MVNVTTDPVRAEYCLLPTVHRHLSSCVDMDNRVERRSSMDRPSKSTLGSGMQSIGDIVVSVTPSRPYLPLSAFRRKRESAVPGRENRVKSLPNRWW
jgi:hypothetical protein